MKNKNIFIIRLLYLIGVFIVLFPLLNQVTNTLLIGAPFLVCVALQIAKYIALIFNRQDYAVVLEKVFVVIFIICWFIFLIYWCYINILSNEYLLVMFSIPFWLVGIYFTKKGIFTNKKKKQSSNKKFARNPKIYISAILVISTFIVGVIMLYVGIRDSYSLHQKSKDYVTIDGYYSHYDIYNSDKNGTTYKITYNYEVNGVIYSIATDDGTSTIPDETSIRQVQYNPTNPQEAIVIKTEANTAFIFIGVFFILGSITFVLGVVTVLGYFDKCKIDVIGVYMGSLLIVVGIGIIIYQNGITMSFSGTIKSFGIWICIPILFIIVGCIQLFRCIIRIKKHV